MGKNYSNIYTVENTELQDFNFDEETKKLFMDNFIVENLEYSDFSDSKDQNLIKNWLFVYITNDNSVNEACFSKDLLTIAYEKMFDKKDVNIENLFNDNEMTNNYICYNKKKSDIKEYNYKEAQILNSNDEDNSIASYYEIKDNKDKEYYISVDMNAYIPNIHAYEEYKEKAKIEDIIKDREFDKQTEVGGSYTGSAWANIDYLKDKGSYEYGASAEINVTLNNGKLIFKQENKEVTVPVENIKEVVFDGESMTQGGNYKIYFLNSLGELYYYDEEPYEGSHYVDKNNRNVYITLEAAVESYKKIQTDKKLENFVFRRNESGEYQKVLEILLKQEDDTLYSIKNNKTVDYLITSNNNVTIYENNAVEIKNKIINYKFKSFYDIEPFTYFGDIDYFITEDDYLYDVDKNKLVTNSKIDKIYKSNEELCAYSYLITFENKETVSIDGYRCA